MLVIFCNYFLKKNRKIFFVENSKELKEELNNLRTNNEISELFTEFVKKFLIQKNKAEFYKVDSHGGIKIKEDFYSKLTNE